MSDVKTVMSQSFMNEKITNDPSIAQLEYMAKIFYQSQMFGIQNPNNAIALMLIAQAEGRHPACVAKDYCIIKGTPALRSSALLSRFSDAGGRIKWINLNDKSAKAKFMAPNGDELELEWTIEMAEKAGLISKEVWQKYPRQLLRSRVASEAIRTIYPQALGGFYTEEEVKDMDPKEIEVNPLFKSSLDSLEKTKSKLAERLKKPVEKNEETEIIIDSNAEIIEDCAEEMQNLSLFSQKQLYEDKKLSAQQYLESIVLEKNINSESVNKWLSKAGVSELSELNDEICEKIILALV